jgi:hypothetical protein
VTIGQVSTPTKVSSRSESLSRPPFSAWTFVCQYKHGADGSERPASGASGSRASNDGTQTVHLLDDAQEGLYALLRRFQAQGPMNTTRSGRYRSLIKHFAREGPKRGTTARGGTFRNGARPFSSTQRGGHTGGSLDRLLPHRATGWTLSTGHNSNSVGRPGLSLPYRALKGR